MNFLDCVVSPTEISLRYQVFLSIYALFILAGAKACSDLNCNGTKPKCCDMPAYCCTEEEFLSKYQKDHNSNGLIGGLTKYVYNFNKRAVLEMDELCT